MAFEHDKIGSKGAMINQPDSICNTLLFNLPRWIKFSQTRAISVSSKEKKKHLGWFYFILLRPVSVELKYVWRH